MSLDAGPAPSGEWAHSGEWECMECGYIKAGVKRQRPRECPECGAPTRALEFFPYGDDAEEDTAGAAPDDASSDDDIYEDEDEELG